jgi:hypothetical protein
MFPFLLHLLHFLLLIFNRHNLNFEEICRFPHTYCTIDTFKYHWRSKALGILEFLKSLWGLGTKEEEGYRTGPPGYIGWRNSFLGIYSGAPYTFKNTGSVSNPKIFRKKKKTRGKILKSLIILGKFCVEAQAERLHAGRTWKEDRRGDERAR